MLTQTRRHHQALRRAFDGAFAGIARTAQTDSVPHRCSAWCPRKVLDRIPPHTKTTFRSSFKPTSDQGQCFSLDTRVSMKLGGSPMRGTEFRTPQAKLLVGERARA
jgi:hypothetical protein